MMTMGTTIWRTEVPVDVSAMSHCNEILITAIKAFKIAGWISYQEMDGFLHLPLIHQHDISATSWRGGTLFFIRFNIYSKLFVYQLSKHMMTRDTTIWRTEVPVVESAMSNCNENCKIESDFCHFPSKSFSWARHPHKFKPPHIATI